jgi:DNA modification methylase
MSMKIVIGDCRDVMQTLEANSVDAIVTDPPYGLNFMGKEWDRPVMIGQVVKFEGRERQSGGLHRGPGTNSRGYADNDNSAFQAWSESWAREAYRVLKPGGHLLAFGGTRTHHRLMVAIEDAGFEIRDCLMWLYGSGFPKSLDVSKALDKAAVPGQLSAFIADVRAAATAKGFTYRSLNDALGGQAIAEHVLKPSPSNAAWPTRDTYDSLRRVLDLDDTWDWLYADVRGAERPVVSELRKGAQSVSTGRYGSWGDGITDTAPATDLARQWDGWGTALKPAYEPIVMARKPLIGSVAANITRYGTGGLNVDGCRIDGVPPSVPQPAFGSPTGSVYNFKAGEGRNGAMSQSEKGRWPANALLDEDAAALLDAQSGERKSSPFSVPAGKVVGNGKTLGHFQFKADALDGGYNDTGGASRFFYTAKASRAERNKGLDGMPERITDDGRNTPIDNPYLRGESLRQNHHPTVKPLDLMQWLVRLVTPPGGTVLDPFMGSGTTLIAADREGFNGIGIEMDIGYVEIARRRCIGDSPMFANVEVEIGESAL